MDTHHFRIGVHIFADAVRPAPDGAKIQQPENQGYYYRQRRVLAR